MSVELLQAISLVAFIVAAILFLVAVALFFLFNVPKVFGEVTGSTARKAIENIRQQNEQTGNKAYRPSPVNAERGRLTDKITPSGKLEKKNGNSGVSVGTEKLRAAENNNSSQETNILSVNQGVITVLNEDTDETTVLSNAEVISDMPTQNNINADDFFVEIELGYTESSEIIE